MRLNKINVTQESFTNELDWDVESVLKAIPEIRYASRDDAEQKLIDSAITPYLFTEIREIDERVFRVFDAVNEVKKLARYTAFTECILILNLILGVLLIMDGIFK